MPLMSLGRSAANLRFVRRQRHQRGGTRSVHQEGERANLTQHHVLRAGHSGRTHRGHGFSHMSAVGSQAPRSRRTQTHTDTHTRRGDSGRGVDGSGAAGGARIGNVLRAHLVGAVGAGPVLQRNQETDNKRALGCARRRTDLDAVRARASLGGERERGSENTRQQENRHDST